MRPFFPDGYLWSQEAIERAALCWFAQQIAEFESAATSELAIKRLNDDVNALTPVEQLSRALGGQPLLSEGLRQQALDLLTQTEHRLRNFMHRGVLTAYYFGGLFDQGRHAVASEFWATNEADRVLMSDRYWPFGKRRAWHDERPSFPLCFLESELATLLNDDPESPPPLRQADNRRGRKPIRQERDILAVLESERHHKSGPMSAQLSTEIAERTQRPRRGPTPGEIDRHAFSDRALFPEVNRLINDHKSVHAAALELALAGKIDGVGSPASRAKRLAKRFRKERPLAAR